MENKRYNAFSEELKRVFGCRVHRISIDAGFTCPNRDGALGTGVHLPEQGRRPWYWWVHILRRQGVRVIRDRPRALGCRTDRRRERDHVEEIQGEEDYCLLPGLFQYV